MPELTLAKCLKVKNRLTGRLNEVQSDVQCYNSVLEEQAGKVDIKALLERRGQILESLVDLKTRLMKANAPIQADLIRQGELKGTVQFLQGIQTRDGVERHGYQNTEVKYVAVLKKQDVDQQRRDLEKEIDTIQDRVDAFNHQTKIEVPQRTLDLAS